MKTELVRMPKKVAKEIKEIQKEFKGRGIKLTFPQAVMIWNERKKQSIVNIADVFKELKL